jgi:hypothetical protein
LTFNGRLQAEYEASLARVRPFSLSLRRLRQGLFYAAALVFLGWLGWWSLPKLEDCLGRLTPTDLDLNLIVACAVTAVFVAVGLAANVFGRQLRRVLRLA